MTMSKLPNLIGIRSILKGWFSKIRVQPWITVTSSGWHFVLTVPGLITHLVASFTLDSARVSPDGFLPSIMLLVVIIVTVVIVVVMVVLEVVVGEGIRFLNFFNDPRIIWEQSIAALWVMCGSYGVSCGGLKARLKVWRLLYGVAAVVAKRREMWTEFGPRNGISCCVSCFRCPQCGVNLLLGTCLNYTYGDGKPVTCCGCEGPLKGGFCSFFASRDENSSDYNQNPNSFNESQNFSDYPPQPQYETNICELCGNDAHYDYDCSPQVPFVYNQNPCFDQNFDNNFPLTSPNFPQQYICCENCGGSHATFQCQPMNQNLSNSNSSGFDQFQPPQFPEIHYSPQETSEEVLRAREDLMETIQAFLKDYDHIPPDEKCMALLLAEERFLKIKQAVEEEQNQPEDMQELLLKLMNDLQKFSMHFC
ncbi:hypothetical protein Tco_0809374 [Tanacetum coccineum]